MRRVGLLERFAELLSEDLPIPAIRERLGITNGHAQKLMCRIRKDLGVQAR